MTVHDPKVNGNGNGNGNGRNAYHTVCTDLCDLVDDLITVDESRRELLRQLTSRRAYVYRQARRRGIPPAVLRAIVHMNIAQPKR